MASQGNNYLFTYWPLSIFKQLLITCIIIMQLNIFIFKTTIRKTKKKTFLISSKYSMQSLCRSLLCNQSAKNLQSYLSLWKPLHGTRNYCGYSSTSPPLSRDQNPKQPEDPDYRIVNCPGGRGECWSFHLTITLRIHIASRWPRFLKLLISIIIFIELPDCSNLFPFSQEIRITPTWKAC